MLIAIVHFLHGSRYVHPSAIAPGMALPPASLQSCTPATFGPYPRAASRPADPGLTFSMDVIAMSELIPPTLILQNGFMATGSFSLVAPGSVGFHARGRKHLCGSCESRMGRLSQMSVQDCLMPDQIHPAVPIALPCQWCLP